MTDPATRNKLKWAMSDPERLRPEMTRQNLTAKAAATFAEPAQSLRDGGTTRRPGDPATFGAKG